jgi:N4-(beta-N-acetylglucosaminyl)-L-asparaginase
MKRRTFIEKSTATTLGALIAPRFFNSKKISPLKGNIQPLVVCTWSFDKASAAALKALNDGKTSLEAAVEGVAIEENNPYNTTVGLGGAPDREGTVSLDACVMNHLGNCGAVLAVENIKNVAALAQAVMEKTPHVILTGNGAKNFALEQGFVAENLLTEESKLNWEKWLKTANYQPVINIENHDTIGMLCRDKDGNIEGACTTSGLAYKMKGRVGDSPIIGSGLFIDNKIGGAVATGMGEEVLKTVGSFLIVELMRQGKTPQEACEEAVARILEKNPGKPNFQVAYLAMNKQGTVGAYSIHSGFTYMHAQEENKIIKADAAF